MDEMKLEAAPKSLALSAQQVADAFVQQYYHILRASPEDTHRFYKNDSIISRPGSEGVMVSSTTVQGINNAIMSSNNEGWDVSVEAVHAQDSIMGSVIVGVTGSLIDKENCKRIFAQTFFLAPQETGGFYVHNDYLQFVDVVERTTSLSVAKAEADCPVGISPKDSEPAIVLKHEKEIISVSEPTPKEAFEISKKVSTPTSPKKKSELPVTKSGENVEEDSVKRISYASVLAKDVCLSTSAQVPLPSVTGSLKVSPLAPSKTASTPLNGAPSSNGGSAAEALKGIHIKNLPPGMTQEALEEEVKKFGAVRPKSVHIREYPEDGYRYAFVEFESAKSAHNVVEAGEIMIGGRNFEVQYKRSSNQGGNHHGRSTYGGAPGPNWRSSMQDQPRGGGGSSTATKWNGSVTVRV